MNLPGTGSSGEGQRINAGSWPGLGLSAAVVGAFDDERVQRIVNMVENERPLYLMPIGRPR